jgi:hypothetical protein
VALAPREQPFETIPLARGPRRRVGHLQAGAEIEQAYQQAELFTSLFATVNVTAFLSSIGFTLAHARDMRYNKIQWSMYR